LMKPIVHSRLKVAAGNVLGSNTAATYLRVGGHSLTAHKMIMSQV